MSLESRCHYMYLYVECIDSTGGLPAKQNHLDDKREGIIQILIYYLLKIRGIILPQEDSFEHWVETDEAPQLMREDLGEGEWAIEAGLSGITAENAAYWAGVEVGFDQYDQAWFGIDAEFILRAQRVGECCAYFEFFESVSIILRVEKRGEEYTFMYK